MVDRLIQLLPESKLKSRSIARRQDVAEIMREVLEAHKHFSSHYDKIAAEFWRGSVRKTVTELFNFCRREMKYTIETDKKQTTRSPAAILKTANTWGVDCKHYAGFIGGVLDALKRQGRDINWLYRFVSYSPTDPIPEHVFIVVNIDGSNIFVDPVLPVLNQRSPEYYYKIDKSINMLNRISGFHGSRTVNRAAVGYVLNADYKSEYSAGGSLALPNITVYDSTEQIKTFTPAPVNSAVNTNNLLLSPVPAPASVPTTAPTPAAGNSNKMLLIAGAAVAAYFLFNKKR